MQMVVLPQDQIDKMVEIMDTILKNPRMTIGEIKTEFNLDSNEYEMIYSLCMPLIREANVKQYWAVKSHYYVRKMKELVIRKDLDDIEFRKRIRKLAFDKSTAEPYMFTATGLEDMLAENRDSA